MHASDDVDDMQHELDRSRTLWAAAAGLTGAVGSLVEEMVALSGMQKQQVADAMMLSPTRVSQLLHGDGNLKISTLSSFAEACGYDLMITATKRDDPAETINVSSNSLRGGSGRPKRSGAGRPLSARSAWELIALAVEDPSIAQLTPPARSRARNRLRHLLAHAATGDLIDVVTLLAKLLRNHVDRQVFVVEPHRLPEVTNDSRVHLSGVSLPGANMSGWPTVEGYVTADDFPDLFDKHLLLPAANERANVILHVVPHETVAPELIGRIDLSRVARSELAVAASLAQHEGLRERREAVRRLGAVAALFEATEAEAIRRSRSSEGTRGAPNTRSAIRAGAA